ncbi:nitrogen fixation protein NifW [Vibrio vulnificus]|nr:nitrogen fixation protein NifW [Vibrio vulnificus]
MDKPNIIEIIHSFTTIEQALDYFEIDFTQKFIDNNRVQVMKLFNGYLIMTKPDDWFSARRALKNAYCKTQRSLLSKETRQACRGCTTCQRR